MSALRLGAVSYLNTKPLVFGLDARPDRFDVRFDVPSQCAALLHEGRVDLGLIPAIEYLRGDYAIVPDIGIVSDGPVASVAIFSRVPIDKIKTLALDPSSRTSVALTKILCAYRWNIAPEFAAAEADLGAMLAGADAALVIGDPAFEIDPEAIGVIKTDLGAEWQALTGLPFVYAMWTGRPGAASAVQVRGLQDARDAGLAHLESIAKAESAGDPTREARNLVYLRDNLRYGLGQREAAGLRRFHELAVEIGVMPSTRPLSFYA
ncbi:MAG: menaquinone biosynthesis protein [Vicinamibacterales bacterium]